MKKIRVPSELMYLSGIVLLAFSVAMLSAVNFGISMIVAPAYLLSLKTGFLSFGQAEYVIQAGLFIVFCVIMGGFRTVYLSSFVTCLVYGAVLDLWRLVPLFNPSVTVPGSMPLLARLCMFAAGMVLTSISVAMFYKTYLYPQVYDFFVKGVGGKFKIKIAVFKTSFDIFCLIVAAALSLVWFKGFEGINWGTLIIALVNGSLIGFFCKLYDRIFEIYPIFKKFSSYFELT